MKQININGISIDVSRINYINIIEVEDERKIYIAIYMDNEGVVKTTTTNEEKFHKWDCLCDVGSVKGTRKQLTNELKSEGFI